MKKGFWISLAVVFLVEMVLYYLFVSQVRDKAYMSQKAKSIAISNLKSMHANAESLPTEAQIKKLEMEKSSLDTRILEVKDFMVDKQVDIQFVKGDKDWVYSSDAALQYKNWYHKERDNIVNELLSAGIVVAGVDPKLSTEGLKPTDIDSINTKLGFKTWTNEAPSKEEVISEHRKLELILSILNSFLKVYKDNNDFNPEVGSFGLSDWRKDRNTSTESVSIMFNCEVPFVSINELINNIEGTSLRLSVISTRISKKRKEKNYSKFPNLEVYMELEFKLFNK